MGSTHTLQVTHTLHVDAMAYVEKDWQTSNGGALQDDQDCTIDPSGGQTRTLKAQRRGIWRGVLGMVQGSHLASSLLSAIKSATHPSHHTASVAIASPTSRG
jgi:hypothetical protein